MLARIRKAIENNDEGFTLIELLVVIIIIGILAAIAIPVFLNQRQKGYDAQTKSDIKNAATVEETYYTDYNKYTTLNTDLTGLGWKQSANDLGIVVTLLPAGATPANQTYSITGQSSSGKYFCISTTAGSTSGISTVAAGATC